MSREDRVKSSGMKATPYPVRIPRHLLELADLRAAEEQIDRSTALRQLLHAGAVTYVLDMLAKGRISLSNAAELLDTTPLAIVDNAREHGVELGAHVAAYRAAEARERPAHTERARGDRGRRLDRAHRRARDRAERVGDCRWWAITNQSDAPLACAGSSSQPARGRR